MNIAGLGVLVAVVVAGCGLDSGGGGASGRSGSGGTSGGTAGVGTGGVGECRPEVCDDQDNDCNGLVDDGSASDACRFRLPNSEAFCVSGQCLLLNCLPGFANCDGQPANGCETPLNMLPCGQCGACGGP